MVLSYRGFASMRISRKPSLLRGERCQREPLIKECATSATGRLGIVSVVAVLFACKSDVQAVMKIVVPLRVELSVWRQPGCEVVFVLYDQVNVTTWESLAHPLGKLIHHIHFPCVFNGMHRVKSQTIKAEIIWPIQRVADEEFAHKAAAVFIEIERVALGILMGLRHEGRRV